MRSLIAMSETCCVCLILVFLLAGDEPTPVSILEVPEPHKDQPAQGTVKADMGRSRGRGRGREGRGRVERDNGPGDLPIGGERSKASSAAV